MFGFLARKFLHFYDKRISRHFPREYLYAVATMIFVAALSCFIIESGAPQKIKMPSKLPADTVFVLCFEFFLLAITGRAKISCTLTLLVSAFIGFLDLHVTESRGIAICFNDVFSIKSAMGVASNYTFKFGWKQKTVVAGILALAEIVFELPIKSKINWRERAGSLALFLALGAFSFSYAGRHDDHLGHGSVGRPLLYLSQARHNFVQKPKFYDEALAEFSAQYGEDSGLADAQEKPPHIIAILSESFADFSIFKNFSASENPIPNFQAAAKNSISGTLNVSVLGGSTAVSEWEFLTANSEAFLQNGGIAYTQYIHKESPSFPHHLKSLGYKTVGVHSFNDELWYRRKNWERLGIDEGFFDESFSAGNKVRKYIGDADFYEGLVARFESARREGKPVFLFGISMQNHGGYDYKPFEPTVRATCANSPDADQFLTLEKITDDALPILLDYLSSLDEKAILVFFGDHQPGLSWNFCSAAGMSAETDKYIAPFFIWSNFDAERRDVGRTSLNFLPQLICEKAEIPLNAKMRFLQDFSKKISALSRFGFVRAGSDKIESFDSASDDERKLLEIYEAIQWKELFE